tara:strand:- start:285 stop:683 length:399 start_codon:yes stop_codon:yes gene_type:complete
LGKAIAFPKYLGIKMRKEIAILNSFLVLAFIATALFIGASCESVYDGCSTLEDPETSDQNWHQRYVEDNCRNCPECCIVLDDREQLEDVFCTQADCPGPDCPCFQGPNKQWWLNETLTLEDPNVEDGYDVIE